MSRKYEEETSNGKGLQRLKAAVKGTEGSNSAGPLGGAIQTLTWSTWHGVDQGSPPLPSVDPGAENHSGNIEHVQA